MHWTAPFLVDVRKQEEWLTMGAFLFDDMLQHKIERFAEHLSSPHLDEHEFSCLCCQGSIRGLYERRS